MQLFFVIAAVYLGIGLLATFVGPCARSLNEEIARDAGQPRIKVFLFRVLVTFSVVILWPILIPSAAKSLAQIEERKRNSLFYLMDEFCGADGTDQDQIPGAVGEFGLNSANPVPTHTPLGSESYLRRLRTAAGEPITFSRLGSTLTEGIAHPIDMYELRDPQGKELPTVFISPYHKRNSTRAPKGYQFTEGQIGMLRARERGFN